MITVLEIHNVRSDILSLPLQDSSRGYEVRDIQGLDPVKASIVSSSMAQVDGAQAQTSRRDTRNITFKVGLNPDYVQHTVASLRTNLYNFLMPKSLINLNFYIDGSLSATTQGIVESCENNMFSADPEVDVSVICYDPDFYAPSMVEVDGDSVASTDTTTVTYTGSIETGVVFTLSPTRDMTGFTIYNTKPDNTIQKFDFEGAILANDIVTVTSIALQKNATITRNNSAFSALYYTQAPIDWITLDPGDNEIRVYSNGDPVPFSLTYTPKYGGL